MPATSVGAPLINAAAAREGVKEAAVSACPARQGKQTVFEVEMLDQTCLGQAPSNLLGRLVLGLERFNELKAHQIRKSYFHWHRAATGRAMSAQTIAIPGPGVEPVDIAKI